MKQFARRVRNRLRGVLIGTPAALPIVAPVPPPAPMFQFIAQRLARLEADPAVKTRDEALAGLRELGLADFGAVLWASPLRAYPKLASLLPPMSSREVQNEWTGASGERLLVQSLDFVRSVSATYCAITGQSLQDRAILDYGCGYARFLRLFSFYSTDLWGVDAWDPSLEESRKAGFADRIKKIEERPTSLPFDTRFDLVFAFSIFTHLRSDVAAAALAAMAGVVRPGGVACITIRPPEYWERRFQNTPGRNRADAQIFLTSHARRGFAFHPHPSRDGGADAIYGDASMSLDWLEKHAVGWRLAAVDRSRLDEMQRYIFLQRL